MQPCNKQATSGGWASQNAISTAQLREALGVAWHEDALKCNPEYLDDAGVRFAVGVLLANVPSQVSTLTGNIGEIGEWDMRNVTDLGNVFNCDDYDAGVHRTACQAFNGDVSNWDVSGVISLRNTFRGALRFNVDISRWRVGRVADMVGTFSNTPAFRKSLSDWDVSQVGHLTVDFIADGGLTWDLGLKWDMRGMKDLTDLFDCQVKYSDVHAKRSCEAFNTDIGFWQVWALQRCATCTGGHCPLRGKPQGTQG